MVISGTKRRFLTLSRVLGVSAIVVLMVGVGLSWRQDKDERQAEFPATTRISNEPAPKTDKPSDDVFKNYQVPPDAPRYIFIPKISVRAMIKPVGITQNNQIASPRNVFDVGWYEGSAKPGHPGAMVVDGHVSSWETNGVFFRLKDLQPEDKITIERGDGLILSYKVIANRTYDSDKVDMDAVLQPVNPDKPGLTLISCTGKVIKGTNEFDKRIVVFAEQM